MTHAPRVTGPMAVAVVSVVLACVSATALRAQNDRALGRILSDDPLTREVARRVLSWGPLADEERSVAIMSIIKSLARTIGDAFQDHQLSSQIPIFRAPYAPGARNTGGHTTYTLTQYYNTLLHIIYTGRYTYSTHSHAPRAPLAARGNASHLLCL